VLLAPTAGAIAGAIAAAAIMAADDWTIRAAVMPMDEANAEIADGCDGPESEIVELTADPASATSPDAVDDRLLALLAAMYRVEDRLGLESTTAWSSCT